MRDSSSITSRQAAIYKKNLNNKKSLSSRTATFYNRIQGNRPLIPNFRHSNWFTDNLTEQIAADKITVKWITFSRTVRSKKNNINNHNCEENSGRCGIFHSKYDQPQNCRSYPFIQRQKIVICPTAATWIKNQNTCTVRVAHFYAAELYIQCAWPCNAFQLTSSSNNNLNVPQTHGVFPMPDSNDSQRHAGWIRLLVILFINPSIRGAAVQ